MCGAFSHFSLEVRAKAPDSFVGVGGRWSGYFNHKYGVWFEVVPCCGKGDFTEGTFIGFFQVHSFRK